MVDPRMTLSDPLLQSAKLRSSGKLCTILSVLVAVGLALFLNTATCTEEPVISMALKSMQPRSGQQLAFPARQFTTRSNFQPVQAFFGFGGGKKAAPTPPPQVIIPPSYNLAIGTVATTAALVGLQAPVPVSAFFGALGALLTVQTTRVRFSFEPKAFEVLLEGQGGELGDSGENFAVGGENRWNYDTFTRWNFVPSESFPLFMYFYETQTKGGDEEQFHLFPVIMNSQDLGDAMKERVGVDKMK
eukprot:gnl/TRDRNA2_/TRDRNA2_68270_c0_seq1.p1 gnl/TRDRNA2_/TRDRNA2_68270_c0~~gnl/TRDRNA2_/TRDRNA2_68270_c0_seq1.p1  ORF type:complete len:259 (-),score=49.06 gnl/TRDRNA2_/TRDRNA2_68270_c0_seq1:95-829(-)